jgi:hypothetical protein
MVYDPSGRSSRHLVRWAAGSAVSTALMAIAAVASERTSTVVIWWIAAALAAGLSVGGFVAAAKVRDAAP